MAFHCGAPTRDGSACERHVREQGMRCHQHRNLGGAALPTPRLTLRTMTLQNPALTADATGWMSARDEITAAHAEEWHEGEAKEADDADEPFWVPEPPHSRTTRILFGDADEPLERDAKLDDLTRDGQEVMDDSLPRRQHPRPAVKGEPNAPVRPDQHGAKVIEDYLRRHDRGEQAADESSGGQGNPRSEPAVEEPDRDLEPAAEEPDHGLEPVSGDSAPEMPPLEEPDFSLKLVSSSETPSRRREPDHSGEPPAEEPPAEEPERGSVRPLFRDEQEPEPDWIGVRPLFRDEAPTKIQPRVEPEPPRPPRIAPLKSVVLNPEPEPDPDPPTLVAAPADLAVPDFVVPGFSEPAPKPPLRTVLSTVLGPELWQRCYAEWSPAHCISLARLARAVDGLAPAATTALRATAGASMRWLGVSRERDELADAVAKAISHPVGATDANRARTVRLYGAAICMALNIPLRRCACHRDLDRDVSSELIRLGLEELAGEVP